MKDDGYFKSINIDGRWYKDDPFILATDASEVFFLEDTKLGDSLRVVQDFSHRHIYDVEEIHEQVQMRSHEACQEEITSPENCTIQDIGPDTDLLQHNEPGSHVSAHLLQSIRANQGTPEREDTWSEDEDDTFLEYHSPDEVSISEDDSDDD
jgi:hypothetical protein